MVEFNPVAKTLASIIPEVCSGTVSEQLLVSDIHTDSREVAPGGLFIALEGLNGNGEKYISNAVENGAVAILVEKEHLSSVINVEVPVIGVSALKKKLPKIAHKFFDHPSDSLSVFGVTGTNGKSTITSLIAQLASLSNTKSGLLGTLGYGLVNEQIVETGMTTPDSVKCHRVLAEFAQKKAKLVAMEVSSHGIDQGRVGAIRFDAAVISNITRDHLDYHGSFESYANTKKSFLLSNACDAAVVNRDDPQCADLIDSLKKLKKRMVTFGLNNPSADMSATIKTYRSDSMDVVIHSSWGDIETELPLVGEFNLSNLLAALSALCISGYSFKSFASLIPAVKPIAGRLQKVCVDSSVALPRVFVDFAHTPDALSQVILALKKHVAGRLWVVFGCGGDRDKGKRPEMGKIASELADIVIVTSDNPRSEDPRSIIDDVKAGIENGVATEVVEDRKVAIFLAVGSCKADDTVLIAGKGHEDYQLIGDKKFPFQDYVVASEALQDRSNSQGVAR